jgi:DNA topoisomerase VI subunit B
VARQVSAKLERTTFRINREMEYFTEEELRTQIDCGITAWPLALTKELIDNSLDACEEKSIAPTVAVAVYENSVSVTDNGPGLSEEIFRGSLNYMVKISNKTRYVSPTRGKQGNALKCVWAAPFVFNGDQGKVEVISPEYAYEVRVTVNRLHQKPQVELIPIDRSLVKTGTFITVWWQRKASFFEEWKPAEFYKKALSLLQSYAIFNPHATFMLHHNSQNVQVSKPITTKWRKWLPSDPTSPHWYAIEDLTDLLRAQITNGAGQKTVRQFVSEFSGLSSTIKQRIVTTNAGLSGKTLSDLVVNDDLAPDKVALLLEEMKTASKPLNATKLGILGQQVMTRRLMEIDGIAEEAVLSYARQISNDVARPHVVEVAIGHRQDKETRRIRFGLNFSPTLDLPLPLLRDWFGEAMIESRDPLSISIHVATPRFDYIGRSKSMLVQGDPGLNEEDRENEEEEELF